MQLDSATILVVDDESDLLMIFKGWLEREGCRVYTAENGKLALQLVQQIHFDAIVSDVRMPVMNGIELARQVSTLHDYVPKIIFVSGFSDVTERFCFALGIETLLPKPSRRADFVAAVRRSLMHRESLWGQAPAAPPETSLAASFPSVTQAREEGTVQFGRGGLCLQTDMAGSVAQRWELRLQFVAEGRTLVAQGVVRWIDQAAREVGIEILSVEDDNRDWLVGLINSLSPSPFIPSSCRRDSIDLPAPNSR